MCRNESMEDDRSDISRSTIPRRRRNNPLCPELCRIIRWVHPSEKTDDSKFKSPNHQDGTVYLTNHRVCYVDEIKPILYSIGVDLDKIEKIETSVTPSTYLIQAGFLKSSPKLTLHFKPLETKSSTPKSASKSSSPQSNWICTYCTFSNPYPSNFSPTSYIPPCLNCGMPPPPGTLKPPAPSTLSPNPPRAIPPLPPIASDGLFPCPRCTFHNHPALTACEICGEPLISPNLPAVLASAEAIDRGVSPAPQPIISGEERNYVRLSFRSGGEKIFLERLKSAMSKKEWEVRPQP